MLRACKISKIGVNLPQTEGYISVDCASWFPNNVCYLDNEIIPMYQVSPYYLKDKEGHLFENVWQGCKIYPFVIAQHQVYSGNVTWDHPEEVHVINNNVLPAYWEWRKKLFNNPYPVRYPNGFHGRHHCLTALWELDGVWNKYDYISARKVIYCREYAKLVKETDAFRKLKSLLDSGIKLQLCEIDVQDVEVTKELLINRLHDVSKPFGHGYVLATCLLGHEDIFS